MRSPLLGISTPALLLAALVIAGPASAATTPTPAKLTLDLLPEAVQKTVRAETQGATIKAITKEKDESGAWVYEVESKVKGLGYDFLVGEDGTLLVGERQVSLDSLSPEVRATLVKAAAKRKILIIESVTKAGKLVYYEAQVGTTKSSTEIKVDPSGALVK